MVRRLLQQFTLMIFRVVCPFIIVIFLERVVSLEIPSLCWQRAPIKHILTVSLQPFIAIVRFRALACPVETRSMSNWRFG